MSKNRVVAILINFKVSPEQQRSTQIEAHHNYHKKILYRSMYISPGGDKNSSISTICAKGPEQQVYEICAEKRETKHVEGFQRSSRRVFVRGKSKGRRVGWRYESRRRWIQRIVDRFTPYRIETDPIWVFLF